MNLLHVAANHHMRQTSCGRQHLQILLRRLRMAFIPEGQRSVEKFVACLGADLDQLIDREALKCGSGFTQSLQILPNNTRVDLADFRFYLTCAVISNLEFIEAFISFAASQRGKMWQAAHLIRAAYIRGFYPEAKRMFRLKQCYDRCSLTDCFGLP